MFDDNFANRNEYVGMKWDGVAIPEVSLQRGMWMAVENEFVGGWSVGGEGGHFIPTYSFLFAKLSSNITY